MPTLENDFLFALTEALLRLCARARVCNPDIILQTIPHTFTLDPPKYAKPLNVNGLVVETFEWRRTIELKRAK